LLDVGKYEQWTAMLMLGFLWLGLSIPKALSFFRHVSIGFPKDTDLLTEGADLFFYGSLSIILILQSLSKTEFRKNGIWFWLRFIKWERIKSYKWEPSKPSVLTIRYQPSFPLFPGWTSWPIPPQYREDVDRILAERLPDGNL
jgi:Domain of unknown function (DUF5673)